MTTIQQDQPRILVHLCCGPCSIYPVQKLMDQGFDVVGLYYNPNIHPVTEYLKRREGVEEVADRLKFPVIYKDSEYDPSVYLREVTFREQNRCFHCYHFRMERTRSIATKGNFDYMTTTLLYSKFQKHDIIAQAGRDICNTPGPEFFYEDFRTGWKEGIHLSRTWGIYRQQYCGCIYSEFERYQKDIPVSPEIHR